MKEGVPNPILTNVKKHDTPICELAKEILMLSKLDWNNINYCSRLPATISVLAESRVRDIIPNPRYCYYM